ncbi:uncharacterized protein BJ171DRAFT_121965 [Polychytrium aggregatum]|uniref:uncharacterized protein n=1 Tax=Polychytrium aggregatum TaxID=110093 RepID=UPI0022FF3768|nr:uncharacterized protein BJ171DRAFT_121965 [Polychytrium aggregatum]KAI9204263.1 hypothetical protein BJ171DRAFT_121965 [Polychytrium aggregatum]
MDAKDVRDAGCARNWSSPPPPCASHSALVNHPVERLPGSANRPSHMKPPNHQHVLATSARAIVLSGGSAVMSEQEAGTNPERQWQVCSDPLFRKYAFHPDLGALPEVRTHDEDLWIQRRILQLPQGNTAPTHQPRRNTTRAVCRGVRYAGGRLFIFEQALERRGAADHVGPAGDRAEADDHREPARPHGQTSGDGVRPRYRPGDNGGPAIASRRGLIGLICGLTCGAVLSSRSIGFSSKS